MNNLKTFEEFKFPKWLLSLNNVSANCDDCGYKEKINLEELSERDIENLNGKKCPRCGTVMINSNDIKIFKNALKHFHVDNRDFKYGKIHYQTKKHK